MRNKAPQILVNGNKRFWLVSSLLFALAIALRWISLDLMMFRLDQAEVAFRAMEMQRGMRPFSGIINSMGFTNAPAYVWSILPAFLINPNPVWATGWHGLLTASMVFPLAIIGRRYRSDALQWLPAIFAAVLPPVVFAGRELWAQHLLAPCAAWALLLFVYAMDEEAEESRQSVMATACLTVLAWAVSIHYSAVLPFVITAGVLWPRLKLRPWNRSWQFLPLLVIILTMVPSGLDWWHSRTDNRPMPDYAAQMLSILPDPLPWWSNLSDAAVASLSINSMCGTIAHADLLDQRTKLFSDLLNALAAVAVGGGLLLAISRIFLKSRSASYADPQKLPTLVVAWVAAQVLVAGLFMTWVQSSYFEVVMPAVWLLVLLYPKDNAPALSRTRLSWGRFYKVVTIVFITAGSYISLNLVTQIAARNVVRETYYIPYNLQLRTVRYARDHGVGPGNLWHLSGKAFERTYDYILRYAAGQRRSIPLPGQTEVSPRAGVVGIMEDTRFLNREPTRANLMALHDPVTIGTVKMVLLPGKGQAEVFVRKYERAGRN